MPGVASKSWTQEGDKANREDAGNSGIRSIDAIFQGFIIVLLFTVILFISSILYIYLYLFIYICIYVFTLLFIYILYLLYFDSEDGGSIFLRNALKLLPDYAASIAFSGCKGLVPVADDSNSTQETFEYQGCPSRCPQHGF
jgi:hypothetical protein